jgi:hypothetical protein
VTSSNKKYAKNTGTVEVVLTAHTTSVNTDCPITGYKLKSTSSDGITQTGCGSEADTTACRTVQIDTTSIATGSTILDLWFYVSA